jgi:hypothetical protein
MLFVRFRSEEVIPTDELPNGKKPAFKVNQGYPVYHIDRAFEEGENGADITEVLVADHNDELMFVPMADVLRARPPENGFSKPYHASTHRVPARV